jgi:hypothetical protein
MDGKNKKLYTSVAHEDVLMPCGSDEAVHDVSAAAATLSFALELALNSQTNSLQPI